MTTPFLPARPAGPAGQQLYIHPLASSPSHLKKFSFVGLFMAKALLESAARGKELGPIALNLPFAEPFWKLLLGVSLCLQASQTSAAAPWCIPWHGNGASPSGNLPSRNPMQCNPTQRTATRCQSLS